MNKLIILLIILITGAIYGTRTPHQTVAVKQENAVETYEGTYVNEAEVERIQKYLQAKNSPYSRYSGAFVWASSYYDIPVELLVAIFGVESTWGAHCYANNCFGIGGSNLRHYSDFIYSLDDLGKTLRSKYYRKWHETGDLQDLAAVYCERSEYWESMINKFIKEQEI